MTRTKPDDRGEVLLYRTEDGRTALDVRLAGETVWLTQTQIAELFAVKVPAISKHIKNIYDDRQLARKTTVSKMETVRTEGKRQVARTVELYNLDIVISVGDLIARREASGLFGQEQKAGLNPFWGISTRARSPSRRIRASRPRLRNLLYFVIIPVRGFSELQRKTIPQRRGGDQRHRTGGARPACRGVGPEGQGRRDSSRHEHAGGGFGMKPRHL